MEENLQYQDNGKAWRGGQEKSMLVMEMLISNFSRPGDVVFDVKALIGM